MTAHFPGFTKPVISRYPVNWKHESTVVLNWKSDEMNFPLNLTVNVDLYYPKVGDLQRDKAKSIPITHMTVHFPGLVLVLQLKSGGVKLVLCSQPPFLVKRCGHVVFSRHYIEQEEKWCNSV
jgi:hypothetical protein